MTRRSSQRALAREIYREMKEERAKQEAAPTVTLPRERGREEDEQGGGGQGPTTQNITAKVRALYEHSAVPVAEIAAVAGVTERTIYKYAAKERWTPRYRWSAAHPRRWRAGGAMAPAKGAAGRFIRRADKGKAFAVGLKATDPRAAAQADAACGEAAALARAAEEKSKLVQLREAHFRAMEATADALHEYNRHIGERDRRGQPPRRHDRVEQALWRVVDLALQRWEWLEARQVGDH
jgi:predicted transcriptional regulator